MLLGVLSAVTLLVVSNVSAQDTTSQADTILDVNKPTPIGKDAFKNWQRPPAVNNDSLQREIERLHEEAGQAARAAAYLEVESWRWGQSESEHYYEVKGVVKNVSQAPLKGVVAVVLVYDKNHQFITSDDGLIEYQPILPGQTSPFTIIGTWNPAMQTASLQFKEFSGGTIPTWFAPRQ